jgi:DUF971 family protein
VIPSDIKLHKRRKTLELVYPDGQQFELTAEFLRVHSPSAEVRGHGPGQEVLQTGKLHVGITRVEPVGHYAVKLHFDDGHNTGIYPWDYLFELGSNQKSLWEDYLHRLRDAGARREPLSEGVQVVRIMESPAKH